VGHLAAWNYFQSVENDDNAAFVKKWKAYIKDDKRVTNDPMEASYIGFNLWVKAVEKANSTDVDKVLDAIVGLETPNLTGGVAKVLSNHHLTKPVLIGEIEDDGQFQVVWSSDGEVEGDAWSDYLPESADLVADWTPPVNCGNYNEKTKTCLGAEKPKDK
jgi:urea transport system substrate-binding protein